MSANVYAYQNADRNTVMADADNINFTGTWSSTGTYWEADRDAVVYGGANYIAIVDNVGGVPTYIPRRGQSKWSSLVLIRSGTTAGPTAQEAYDLAENALDTANTALTAANAAEDLANEALDGVQVAGVALVTAWAGTAAAAAAVAAADGASDLAYHALQTAWSGTNGANSAFSVAVQGTNAASAAVQTADAAFSIAVAGTNGINQAVALANSALQAGWAGTAAANEAGDIADIALLTAWSGTSGANSAFSIAVAGTNLAQTAKDQADLLTTWFGTLQNGDSSELAYLALQTAWAGTQSADYATSLAIAGTNAAQQARAVADVALVTAWAGTNAANGNCGFSFVIDGGGQAIETGFKGYVEVPFGMWITRWTLIADQSGTAVVDVLKSNGYAGFPTTPSIAGSAKLVLPNAQKNQDTTLEGWTRQISGGDIVGFAVDLAATVEILTVAVAGTRS